MVNRVVDPTLSQYARGYVQSNHVGSTLFPLAPVPTSQGKVIEFGKEAFRRYNSRHAPGSDVKKIEFGMFGKSYQLIDHALDVSIPEEFEIDCTHIKVDTLLRGTNIVMSSMTLALEIEQAEIATDPYAYNSDHKTSVSGSDKWSDPASKPIVQLRDSIEVVRRSIGIRPNVAMFSASAFAAFEENVSVIDRFKQSSPVITTDIVASLLRLEKVVIGEAVYADDKDDFVDVWGNNVILSYSPIPTQGVTIGVEQPSFGYTYYYKDHPFVHKPIFDHNKRSWVCGVTYRRIPVLTGISAGFLIQNPA
ncbi:Major capsid protein [Azospirillaceae bacterium]